MNRSDFDPVFAVCRFCKAHIPGPHEDTLPRHFVHVHGIAFGYEDMVKQHMQDSRGSTPDTSDIRSDGDSDNVEIRAVVSDHDDSVIYLSEDEDDGERRPQKSAANSEVKIEVDSDEIECLTPEVKLRPTANYQIPIPKIEAEREAMVVRLNPNQMFFDLSRDETQPLVIDEDYMNDSESEMMSPDRKDFAPTGPMTSTPKSTPPVSADKVKPQWLDKCKYKCKVCQVFTTSRQTDLTCHLKRVHRMLLKEYRQQWGNLMEKTVTHVCQVCGYRCDWNYRAIAIHIKTRHPILTPSKYVEKFERSYSVKRSSVIAAFRSAGPSYGQPFGHRLASAGPSGNPSPSGNPVPSGTPVPSGNPVPSGTPAPSGILVTSGNPVPNGTPVTSGNPVPS